MVDYKTATPTNTLRYCLLWSNSSILTRQCVPCHFILSPTCPAQLELSSGIQNTRKNTYFLITQRAVTRAEINVERKLYLMLLYLVYTNTYAVSCVCVYIYIYRERERERERESRVALSNALMYIIYIYSIPYALALGPYSLTSAFFRMPAHTSMSSSFILYIMPCILSPLWCPHLSRNTVKIIYNNKVYIT